MKIEFHYATLNIIIQGQQVISKNWFPELLYVIRVLEHNRYLEEQN